ncbi:MAG: nicotinate (nicotinamide) nucleotide adenylyltransferase [Oscillospiraceae bacterium]|nr:nicotinate (nicotinamide) nucleotide adenylyltransferase [Oscillospiraceae bacterium]
MKTAIFGGSFNPVHNGHINLVREIASRVEIDRVIVVPTYISPFKKDEVSFVAEGKDRLEMCRLAFKGLPFVTVSDYEISAERVSYTIDTATHFRKCYPDDELFLIIGSDMLLSFKKWRQFEDILKICTIVAASRENNNDDFALLTDAAEELRPYGNVILTKISPYKMSSTLIREEIMKNRDMTCYMPENVVKYIVANNIYG